MSFTELRGRGPVWSPPLGRALLALACVACVAVAALSAVEWAPLWAPLLPLLVLLGLVGAGVAWMGSGVFGAALLRGAPDRPLVALTFDDGPDPQGTAAVASVLARHGARGTFFVIGARAERHPELLAALARDGHQIENHSYDHGYDTTIRSVARLSNELRRTQDAVVAAAGRAPRWLRPPVGLLSPRVSAAARRAGLRLCGYSGKARDGLARTTVEEALRRLEAALRPGAILVLHDAAERDGRRPIAPEVLERLLPLLVARGLRPVTLDELVGEAPLREAL